VSLVESDTPQIRQGLLFRIHEAVTFHPRSTPADSGDAAKLLVRDTVGVTEIPVNVGVEEKTPCQMIHIRELPNFMSRPRTLIARPPCTMGKVTT
jgi:hypothetical protein